MFCQERAVPPLPPKISGVESDKKQPKRGHKRCRSLGGILTAREVFSSNPWKGHNGHPGLGFWVKFWDIAISDMNDNNLTYLYQEMVITKINVRRPPKK